MGHGPAHRAGSCQRGGGGAGGAARRVLSCRRDQRVTKGGKQNPGSRWGPALGSAFRQQRQTCWCSRGHSQLHRGFGSSHCHRFETSSEQRNPALGPALVTLRAGAQPGLYLWLGSPGQSRVLAWSAGVGVGGGTEVLKAPGADRRRSPAKDVKPLRRENHKGPTCGPERKGNLSTSSGPYPAPQCPPHDRPLTHPPQPVI